jgi:hypothetical protein
MDILTGSLLVVDFFLFSAFLYFAFESHREQEYRATRNGILGAIFTIFIAILIFVPQFKTILLILFVTGGIFSLCLLIPAKPNEKALKGAKGYLKGEPERFDERDSIFARYRSLVKGTKQYNFFYKEMYPEKEEHDAKRRQTGILGISGKIDNEYQPNVAMMHASFSMPMILGQHALRELCTSSPFLVIVSLDVLFF